MWLLLVKWKLVLIVVATAGVISALWIWESGSVRARERLFHVEQELADATEAVKINAHAVESCLAVNAENQLLAEAERRKSKAAAKRIIELEAEADQSEVRINDEANTLRASGLGCPAIDDTFRKWAIGVRGNP